jgi:FkbM family methyltransferase
VVPPALLRRLARQPGPVAVAARSGLLGRAVRVPAGPAAGLVVDPGETNADIALGTYETPVQERLTSMLRPGAVFYDVGANVGFYTVLAARAVGPDGAVYAFEPVPANAAVLVRNVLANGGRNVRLVGRAVSAATTTERLLLTPYAGGHFLASTLAEGPTVGEVHVETVALDDFVATTGVRPPDVVKIDVEGAELDVLRGMHQLLCAHGPDLLVELDDADRAAAERKADEVAELLRTIGYRIERLSDAYPHLEWSVVHLAAHKATGVADG